MRADIAKLQRDIGTTTLYVTHDQVEAMTMGDRVAVMSQGVLQQVDTPQRLYDHPANLFVAGFIGTPPMNLLEATLVSQDGSTTLRIGEQPLPVSDEVLHRFPAARNAAGRRIVMGIRAGDLFPAATRPELPTLTARLDLVESLGSESIAYFHIDAMAIKSADLVDEEEIETVANEAEGVTATRPNLVAAFDAREALGLKLGTDLAVGVDTARMHLFDAESGEPLT
jgi:multiple sugar transport system ATP-binding protein